MLFRQVPIVIYRSEVNKYHPISVMASLGCLQMTDDFTLKLMS
jgi:hypothetical protein